MSATADTRLQAAADALLTEPRTRESVQSAWDLVYQVVCVLDHDIMQGPRAEDDSTRAAHRFIEVLAGAGHPVTLDAMSALALALARVRDDGATEEQAALVRSVFSVIQAATVTPI